MTWVQPKTIWSIELFTSTWLLSFGQKNIEFFGFNIFISGIFGFYSMVRSGFWWFLKDFFPQTKDIIFLIRQQLIFEWYYICQKSRQSINKKLYQKGPVTESFIHFELKKTLAKIVDVHLDADLNLFCLTLLAGTAHVLISSLFSQVSIFKIKMY